MNYQNGLKTLRAKLIEQSTGARAPEERSLETFVPTRFQNQMSEEGPEDLMAKSANWMSEIKKASIEYKKAYEELRSKRPKARPLEELAQSVSENLIRPKARPEDLDQAVSDVRAQPLIERRGERPSRYTPENVSGQPSQKFGGKEAFVEALYPKAIEIGAKIGVDPRLIMAQAALETGWGKSVANNNFFGIKATGDEPSVEVGTKEEINGQLVGIRDRFRAYESPEQSFEDYATFLATNNRYLPMLTAKGLDAQLAALGKSGYATDSKYASKLRSIIDGLPDPKGYAR